MTHAIARLRLQNSGLTGTQFSAPEDVVRWHGAMQAQDYGPAKWAVGQRSKGLVDEDLERALAAGLILRTHVLRPTWHFVARDDIRWLLALTGPRVRVHIGPRLRELELDERTLDRCEAAIKSALEGGHHLTRNEIGDILDEAGIDRSGQRLPWILTHCELNAIICSGAIRGKQQTYALLDERATDLHRFDRDQALGELIRRYLRSHGPATIQDLRWWSSILTADIKKSLDTLGSEVRSKTIGGITFWSMTENASRVLAVRGAHLLQPWDEFVVGYTESRYFGDPLKDAVRTAWKDRSFPFAVILVNGRVAGHWRRTTKTNLVKVEVHTYEKLKASEVRAVEAEAASLGRFVGSETVVEVTQI